ncbi:hypothetical protein ACIBP6_03180 [Nonomuraea terrae]|uniref:hypothetical protein n=1 Tax=Nonomuraea terrae TaxID=2530383 RepID=UPI0037A2AE69
MNRLNEQYNGDGGKTLEESEQEELARLRREKAELVKQHAQGADGVGEGTRPAGRRA